MPARGPSCVGWAAALGSVAVPRAAGAPAGASELAPWYCPPADPRGRACVRGFRSGMAEPYIEETVVPMTWRVLAAIDEDPSVQHPENFTRPLRHMSELLEAMRLLACSIRFAACYAEPMVLGLLRRDLCFLAEERQRDLVPFTGPEWEPLCDGFIRRGDSVALMRSVAQPLQGLVRAALPRAAPPALGNGGSRFDFEAFFEARGRLFVEQTAAGRVARPGRLHYPSLFAPGAACDDAAPEPGGLEGPFDVARALRRIGRQVPLSRFAINLGAADGACGAGAEDWNADPANCLVEEGYSAVVVEGDPRWHGPLRKKFGGRKDRPRPTAWRASELLLLLHSVYLYIHSPCRFPTRVGRAGRASRLRHPDHV
ncbi:unnamed protein product [Prorocentrum cordatum]|uniref:Uncharacterized protein n=1 Tax=Prorocentrum cordatum TaxID=2364126 RepID=A0ABN9PJY6_9DINO|nr:unnamed protein product [Polarella glacialis]